MPRIPTFAVLTLLLSLAHPAHAAPVAPIDRITGSVTYLERVALPQDATLTVELLDVSRQDTRSDRLARLTLPAGTRQVPLAFELPFYRVDIKPAHRYTVRATLSSGGGELLFTTAQHVPVLAEGVDRNVQLVLQRVQHATRAVLENTYWKLVEVNGRPAQVLPSEREAHILLLAGRASGSSGCNKLMGSYTHNPTGALHIGPLASTRMACPPDMMAQESALLDAFDRARAYRIDGEALTLLNGDAVLARFEARYFK